MGGISLGSKNLLKISPCDADGGDIAGPFFEVQINPASYQHRLSVQYNQCPTLGQPGATPKFSAVNPEKLTLPQLILDGTGVVSLFSADASSPMSAGLSPSVTEMLTALRTLVYDYQGDIHEPNVLRFVWGDMNFVGVVESMDIDYTLFKPSGQPLRAKVTLGVLAMASPKKIAQIANPSSPDLSHLVAVRAGDTLPLLCERIYADPGYYMEVARVNGLVGFRALTPGMLLRFPPIN
ncbi:peptidoglycan-binding protein [Massilia antarctica]|uniref:Peptidoglycan-binding protein n=1 Tax=Massilia antarctica TaxID=2765360 RepID=A0AA48WAC4_9BURK|nr:peptidoglycan-binding protein [Massilia antarctica]QPI48911.1 peptidoglycan-binding protein [Massilia antarctica]